MVDNDRQLEKEIAGEQALRPKKKAGGKGQKPPALLDPTDPTSWREKSRGNRVTRLRHRFPPDVSL